MAYSYTAFTGNGSTTQYAVAFPYIRREHVAVTVAGIPSTFTWVNNSLIQMDAAPAAAAAVRVYRTTPISAPLVDFADGATLVAADLDTNSRQSIYIQQELDDAQTDNLPNVIPNGNKGDITTSVGGTVWAINNGAVTESKLAASAVTSAKILDGTIVNADVNASAGITAGKLSFTQAGTGAVARTVDSRLKDVVSVKDFGAIGDGVANDTAAIQAALDSGKAVFLPSGTYKVTSQLTMGAPYVFYGEGSLSSVLLTSCVGWTLKAGGAPGNFILKDIHFLGANSNQGTATAKGFQNTTGGAQHEWLIEGCRFTYLLQAIDTPQNSYTGAIRECYVAQCGNGTANYAVQITGDSNNLLVDHLSIQSSETGWVCRGLLVGAPSPSTSQDPLGVTFNHLYIENCHADYAATFRTSCRINGGYFESYETTTNQINFDPVANREVLTISGALIGADIIGRTDLVKLDGCSMLRNNTVQQVNSRYPEFRWVQKLANGVLPIQIRQTEIVPLSVTTTSDIKPKVFNLNGWSSSQNVVGDLPFSGYFQGENANTATVVSNSDLNLGGSNVLRYSINTNGAGVAFGGAMIVDFQVPTQYQYASSYIYAYALVRKVRSDVDYQVVLTTANVDNASSYATLSGTTNNDWHLLISAAPANTGMSAGGFQVGIRAFGAAGGNPPTASTIDIHSIGAAIGGPPTFLASEVNPLLVAKAEWRKQYENAWINNVLNQLVSTGACNSSGASMTFRSITIGATARTLLTTTAGTAITTSGTGTFPVASVGCGDTINVYFSTSVASYATRVYGTSSMTASLNSIP